MCLTAWLQHEELSKQIILVYVTEKYQKERISILGDNKVKNL